MIFYSYNYYYKSSAFLEWKTLKLPAQFEWEVSSNLMNWGKGGNGSEVHTCYIPDLQSLLVQLADIMENLWPTK